MKRRGLLDVAHPMFRPVWARALAVALVGAWTLFEVVRGAPFWAMLFAAATGWLIWKFFIRFEPEDYE